VVNLLWREVVKGTGFSILGGWVQLNRFPFGRITPVMTVLTPVKYVCLLSTNYYCSFSLLTSFFGILKLHLDEIIPIITPIIILSRINNALGVLSDQNQSLISTISVFCKAKITKISESKIIMVILNFIVDFF